MKKLRLKDSEPKTPLSLFSFIAVVIIVALVVIILSSLLSGGPKRYKMAPGDGKVAPDKTIENVIVKGKE